MLFYIEPLYFNPVTKTYDRIRGHTYLPASEIKAITFHDNVDHANISTSDVGHPYTIEKDRAMEIVETLNEQ